MLLTLLAQISPKRFCCAMEVLRQRAVVDRGCFCSAPFGKGAGWGGNVCNKLLWKTLLGDRQNTCPLSSEIVEVLLFTVDCVCNGKDKLLIRLAFSFVCRVTCSATSHVAFKSPQNFQEKTCWISTFCSCNVLRRPLQGQISLPASCSFRYILNHL